MRVAVLTPLPPARTGVAHYASLLLPALAARCEVRAFETLEGYRRDDYDAVVYQLGNNPYHELMYREAMQTPGVVVLHDLVLHHLLVETTLARGDVEGYVEAMRENHGEEGAAWARGRAAGLHTELANFLLPASIEVARRSRAVIVHNLYAAERLRSFGVTTPIHVVPHPFVPQVTPPETRDAVRRRFRITPEQRVIGFFGFLTSAKRGPVVLEAFHAAREQNPDLVLLVVGEPAPDIDRAQLAGEGIVTTGYVSDDEFPLFYTAADRLVNLRYPSAGETSGTLIRALEAGKPVAVSDYAQFAEFPESCVVRIPLGAGEVDALKAFFLDELPDRSREQRAWLAEHASESRMMDGYLAAIRDAVKLPDQTDRTSRIPIFPLLELVDASIGTTVDITVRNAGSSTIRTKSYGQPEYRMIAKLFDREVQVDDHWLALPCDLRPGETAVLRFAARRAGSSLRLHHALQDVPQIDDAPWATFEAAGVR